MEHWGIFTNEKIALKLPSRPKPLAKTKWARRREAARGRETKAQSPAPRNQPQRWCGSAATQRCSTLYVFLTSSSRISQHRARREARLCIETPISSCAMCTSLKLVRVPLDHKCPILKYSYRCNLCTAMRSFRRWEGTQEKWLLSKLFFWCNFSFLKHKTVKNTIK